MLSGRHSTLVRKEVFLGAFDVLAFASLYFVLQDLASRMSYVRSERLVPGISYYIFFHTSSIQGSGIQFQLVSPPVLDWVQVIIVLLVLVNGYYIASILRRARRDTP